MAFSEEGQIYTAKMPNDMDFCHCPRSAHSFLYIKKNQTWTVTKGVKSITHYTCFSRGICAIFCAGLVQYFGKGQLCNVFQCRALCNILHVVSVHHIATGFYSLLREYVLVFVCVCTCTLAFDSWVSKHQFKYRLVLFKNYKKIKIYIFKKSS